MSSLPIYIHVLPLCTSLCLTAPPGCYPLLCKQQKQHVCTIINAFSNCPWMFLADLWMQTASSRAAHWSFPGNMCSTREKQNRRPCKSTAHFLIMWKTEVDSLLPQTLCKPSALLQILKVSPSAKAIKYIHELRVRVRNCIMKEKLGVI